MKTKITFALCCMLALFGARAAAQSAVSSSLQVWVDDLTLTADGTTIGYLHISEKDTCDYCSFQMCINVPKGIKLQKVKVGRETYDALPTARITRSHTLTCGMANDSTLIKMGVLSGSNDLFFKDDEEGNPLDELYAIAITADPSTVNGTYTLTMEDIKFNLPNSFAYIPESPKAATLTIVGGQDPTGITEVSAGKAEPRLYDLAGRRVTAPAKGIVIQDNKKVVVR